MLILKCLLMDALNATAKYEIRSSVKSDIDWLAPRLRKADKAEIKAFAGVSPKDALTVSFVASTCRYTAEWEGEPIIMFGAGPVEEGVGAVWLLGTDMIKKVRVPFLRESKRCLEALHDEYPLLFNYVDARNTLHIRWLKWLGFTFINRHPEFGVARIPFYEFVRIR